ncbi:MAG: hypothetical protein IJO67_05510 [Clostridia bacterium]|nr:hypothetical protein [Clostridia bacterium]
MPSYEHNKKSAEKYLANQDRITIRVPKESQIKKMVQDAAEKKGISVNAYLNRVIMQALICDGFYDYGEPIPNEPITPKVYRL